MKENNRNYNLEVKDADDHQYAYNFDFDIMHNYMLKSFLPFFKEGNFLELGSFKGDFTQKFLRYFDDITCVEASDEAIAIAKNEITEIAVSDMTGRALLMRNAQGGLTQLDMSHLTSGTYVVTLRSKNELLREVIQVIR